MLNSYSFNFPPLEKGVRGILILYSVTLASGVRQIQAIKGLILKTFSIVYILLLHMRNFHLKSFGVKALAFYYNCSGGLQTSTHHGNQFQPARQFVRREVPKVRKQTLFEPFEPFKPLFSPNFSSLQTLSTLNFL
jgi:hypothetical protein